MGCCPLRSMPAASQLSGVWFQEATLGFVPILVMGFSGRIRESNSLCPPSCIQKRRNLPGAEDFCWSPACENEDLGAETCSGAATPIAGRRS